MSWEGRELMDGGVANNTPISHAIELGAERDLRPAHGNACALAEPPKGALAMALHALSLLTQRRLIDDIESHEDRAKLVVLPPPCPLSVQPIDFSHAGELIERALCGRMRVPRRRRRRAAADPHAHAWPRRHRDAVRLRPRHTLGDMATAGSRTLHDDIDLLGGLLGDIVQAQEGMSAFALDERVRTLCKARRAGDQGAAAQLRSWWRACRSKRRPC